MKQDSWFSRFLKGIGLGIGSLIPGLCIYTFSYILRINTDFALFEKNSSLNTKKSFGTYFPIFLGGIIGLLGSLFIINWAFNKATFFFICIFAGLLIGSLPSLIKQIADENPQLKNIFIAILSALVAIGFGVLSIILYKKEIIFSTFFYSREMFDDYWILFVIFIAGVISSCALTVPGFSGTLILFTSGIYTLLMTYITKWIKNIFDGNFDYTFCLITMLIIFAAGFFVGAIFISKYTDKLYKNHKRSTTFAMIGFVIGGFISLFINFEAWKVYANWLGESILSTYSPTMTQDKELPISILFLGIMTFFSFMIFRAQKNLKNSKK